MHGDARDVNVLVRQGADGALFDVRFCDFDWAGAEGVAVYPLLMSESVPWALDARPGHPLKQAHDVHLLSNGGVDIVYR